LFSDVATYLTYFRGVRRRTIRDVTALPEQVETWTPPSGDGEAA